MVQIHHGPLVKIKKDLMKYLVICLMISIAVVPVTILVQREKQHTLFAFKSFDNFHSPHFTIPDRAPITLETVEIIGRRNVSVRPVIETEEQVVCEERELTQGYGTVKSCSIR
jgi:hypothetical protein